MTTGYQIYNIDYNNRKKIGYKKNIKIYLIIYIIYYIYVNL